MDFFQKKICIATYTCQKYLPRALKTIEDIRTSGCYYGDIVVMTDETFDIPPEIIHRFNLKVKKFPDIDVSELIKKIQAHPFVNSDKREYEKTKQWNKMYSFHPYFKQWDYVMFVDAGLRVFGKIENFYSQFTPNKIVALDDGHPEFEKKFKCQLELTNVEVVNKLAQHFDLESSYFLNCLYLYDTALIQDDTLDSMISIMNEYPIFRCNEMTLMGYYFVSRDEWKPLDIYLPNGSILFDWSERGGRQWSSYVSLKYPTTRRY